MVIEESFEAKAPKDRVYAFIRDPEQCFPCLPGATFGKMHPDGKFEGKISVAVGPVKVSYDGWAVYEDEDPAAGRLVLKGEGRESGGAGIVKMDMTCTIVEIDGVSRVEVVADVGLAGKIIRFGRGMVRGIAGQVFQDFTTRARARLENTTAAAPAPAASADPFGAPTAADPFGAPPAPPAGADPFSAAPAAPAPAADERGPSEAPTVAAAPIEENAPANGLSLFFRALWAMITGLFRRS